MAKDNNSYKMLNLSYCCFSGKIGKRTFYIYYNGIYIF